MCDLLMVVLSEWQRQQKRVPPHLPSSPPHPLPSFFSHPSAHFLCCCSTFPMQLKLFLQKHCAICLFFCNFPFSFEREILRCKEKGQQRLVLIYAYGEDGTSKTDCTCQDWHGGCRQLGDNWVDNGIWEYRCAIGASNSIFVGCQFSSKSGEIHKINAGDNKTVDGFWTKCEANEILQKLEIEPKCIVGEEYKRIGETFRKDIFQWICTENGRSVIGCFYRDETDHWNVLKLGEVTSDGFIRHSCDRNGENPGVVQYHSEILDDIPHESPSNKGRNRMAPDLVGKRLKNTPTEWTFQNAPLFVSEVRNSNLHIRYLPASRKINASKGEQQKKGQLQRD